MGYAGRHVVVAGGTGALGAALVEGLLAAGATCHVPCRTQEAAEAFPHRAQPGVTLYPAIDLTDETSVAQLFGR
ncbi:MAG: NAD-dependent epimerase/dehydratase family protein, partial [Pseudorhodoplanes sp.]